MPCRVNTFIREAGAELGRIARLAAGSDARRAALKQFLDQVVDLPELARFCLGRFWNEADESFRQRYLTLFETVIFLNVQNRLGAYREGGSNAIVGAARSVGDGYDVPTSVRSDNDTPVNIIWRVSFAFGGPRITDVTAEGIRVCRQFAVKRGTGVIQASRPMNWRVSTEWDDRMRWPLRFDRVRSATVRGKVRGSSDYGFRRGGCFDS